jgi:cytosine/adenosine deaminase-related metal-dependent hydrolase
MEYVNSIFSRETTVLWVHNLYTKEESLERVMQLRSKNFWVMCPRSNYYIQRKMPDLRMFMRKDQKIALGTDSLASNTSLSVFDEVLAVLENFPGIKFDEVLTWATLNGAAAIKADRQLGSLEVGKTPGLNLIYPFDFNNWRPTQDSCIKPLIKADEMLNH